MGLVFVPPEVEGVRIVARAVAELWLPRTLRWQEALGVDRLDAMIVQVMLNSNLAHGAAHEPLRPVSMLSIAQAMVIPYETLRRRVQALTAAGLVAPLDNGHAVATAIFDEGRPATLDAQDVGALRAIVRQMEQAGLLVRPAASAPISTRDAARLLLRFTAEAIEAFAHVHGNLVSAIVWTGIVAANVRHLRGNAALERACADEHAPPPDHLRRPVTIRALARDLRMPAETTRRHVATLVAEGRAQASEEGVIVPAAVLMGPRLLRYNRRTAAAFHQLVAQV